VALALMLAYMPYRFLGDDNDKHGAVELSAELHRTNTQIERLERSNARLRREIHALRTDPEAIEDIARDELGFVKPTDQIIRIIGLDGKESSE